MPKRKTQVYTEEFKQSSVQLAVNSDQPISRTAADLGINVNTLHGWVSKYHPKSKAVGNPNKDDNLSEELKRLRREIARLKQERDILKKAATYFASEAS